MWITWPAGTASPPRPYATPLTLSRAFAPLREIFLRTTAHLLTFVDALLRSDHWQWIARQTVKGMCRPGSAFFGRHGTILAPVSCNSSPEIRIPKPTLIVNRAGQIIPANDAAAALMPR